MQAPTPEQLARLMDESACRDVIARYSAAIDWVDEQALATVFWPDACLDFGAFFKGVAPEGIAFLIASAGASVCRTHSLGTPWIKLDGSRARAETPAFNLWISRNPDASLTRFFFTARYLWGLERRGDEWRAASLAILINTAQVQPYDPAVQPPGLPLREGMDPAHALFPGVHL
jgi:SnoaL-like domain